MDSPIPNGMARSERILTTKLELLYHNSAAVLTNVAVSLVIAYLLSDYYPPLVLGGWIAAMIAVAIGRLLLQRHFERTPAERRCTTCTAARFALGALAAGLLWGAICLGLPAWGDDFDFVVLAVAAAGMTAGAVTTISVHYPAYLCYMLSFAVPLTAVSLSSRNPDIAGAGAMMIVYYAVISVAAHRASKFIGATISLRVDNEILEASLKRTRVERDAARIDKWTTLSQLSHELRTPLNAILGFSEAMRGEIFGSLGHPRYREYADHVMSSGRDLLTLTEELLLLSQGESGALVLKEDQVDVTAMIRTLIDLKSAAAAKAGLELKADIAASLPPLLCDRGKVRQMLLALTDNAIKFTPSGGTVTIGAVLREGAVELSVHDSGIGMSADQIPLALEPFGRTASAINDNTPGAGLGLPICKRLAELHGAELSLVSVPGEGTTCTVAFPASRSVTQTGAAAAA